MKHVVFAVALLLLSACGSMQAREKLSQGMLELDLPTKTFLQVWGNPDRTSVVSGEEIIKGSLGGFSGNFYKGKETYQVWTYTSRKTDLVFSRQRRLVGWKTELTVQQLAVPDQ